LNLFFTARIGKEKEDSPNWRFVLVIAPIAFLDLLTSVAFISSLVVLTKGLGLAIGIVIIIPSNFLLLKYKKYSQKIKDKLQKQKRHRNPSDLQICVKSIPGLLQLSALTSWIMSTVIVKSNIRLQLIFSLITILVYSFLTAGAITFQALVERHSIQDFTFLVCAPKNVALEQTYSNILSGHPLVEELLMFMTYSGVRLCRDGELSADFLLYALVPILCVAVVIKSFAVVMLYGLSDCRRLRKFVKCLG
jgi:hypothetical protein